MKPTSDRRHGQLLREHTAESYYYASGAKRAVAQRKSGPCPRSFVPPFTNRKERRCGMAWSTKIIGVSNIMVAILVMAISIPLVYNKIPMNKEMFDALKS
jgi:hypothetical protein